MMFCPSCRLEQPTDHVYCVRCGANLPSSLLRGQGGKRTQWFAGVKVAPGDAENAYLRVSHYSKEQRFEAAEGSVTLPGHHVRFSVWVGDEARCVMSISETEGRGLASFLTEELTSRNGDQQDTGVNS
jgi:hypothetical protein